MTTYFQHWLAQKIWFLVLVSIVLALSVLGHQAFGEPITITANDQMRFAPAEFTVVPGDEVTLTLHNIGKLPKEAMGHNLVILQKGADAKAFAAASMLHQKTDFIAPEWKDRILAAAKLLGPDQTDTITFKAPAEMGDYAFVCSFPGHAATGMVGVMHVK